MGTKGEPGQQGRLQLFRDTLNPDAGATEGAVLKSTLAKLPAGSPLAACGINLASNLCSAVGAGSPKAARSRTQLPKQPGMLKAPVLTDHQHFTQQPGDARPARGLLLSAGMAVGTPRGRESCCPKSRGCKQRKGRGEMERGCGFAWAAPEPRLRSRQLSGCHSQTTEISFGSNNKTKISGITKLPGAFHFFSFLF